MRRISTLFVLLWLMVGCAGPKRMLPVVTEPPVPSGPGQQVPDLLAVGLAENQASITIEADGPAELLAGEDGRVLLRLGTGGQPIHCTLEGGSVAWQCGARQGRAQSLSLRPLDASSRVGYEELQYRGDMQIIRAPRGGGLTLVNTVDLESYLKGVVPWEIGRHPRERMAALEAQAVAARTYTIAHLGARRDRGFDVFASVMDQVYKGAADEDELCNEAVENTAGLVLRADGEEIEAYYSACCGGRSSRIEEVWARGPRTYLGSAEDGPDAAQQAFCAESRHYHWRETWLVGQLEEILGRTLPAYLEWLADSPARSKWAGPAFSPRSGNSDPGRPGRLRNLEILSRTTSGRVADLALTTDAGVYHVRGDRTRWVLAPASGNPFILRSAMFDLELERDEGRLTKVAVRGRGFGHGIGLCQTGALERASQGQSVAEILDQYYPGAMLTKIGQGRDR